MSFPVSTGSSPGVPAPERLQAAVDFVVERLRPDQIVLFGSAVRGAMSAHSDLDLLVIREPPPGSPRAGHHHWSCPATGDDVDVVLWSYDHPSDENPDRTWADTRPAVRDVLHHAERRVPALVEETRRALQRSPSSDDR